MDKTKAQRVTKAHRAAVCGLLLAGLPFIQSCKIVGVNHLRLKTYLPPDWGIRAGRRAHIWHGERLEELREAWCDPLQKTRTIANRFNLKLSSLYKLVTRHGWPRRPKGPERLPLGLRHMSATQRTAYRKIQAELGRDAAIAAVFP